jgi:hypothetical protein
MDIWLEVESFIPSQINDISSGNERYQPKRFAKETGKH